MRHREDLENDLASLAALLRNGPTMKKLVRDLGVSERTIHRWFDLLEEQGHLVTSTRKNPKIYKIS